MDYLVETFRSSDPLRQGDVFRCATDAEVYGILVTADCDIEHGKHGGELTLIMAYPPSRYVREWWSRSEFARLRSKLVAGLLDQANLAFAGKGNISLLNEAGLAALVDQFEPQVLSERLSVPAGKKRDSFVTQLNALKKADGDFSEGKNTRSGEDIGRRDRPDRSATAESSAQCS